MTALEIESFLRSDVNFSRNVLMENAPEQPRKDCIPSVDGLFIGNKWVSPAGDGSFPVMNPAAGTVLAHAPAGTALDIQRAVIEAQAAFKNWRRVPAKERGRVLNALADRIEARLERYALLDCLNSGNTITAMRQDVKTAIETLRYFAGLAMEIKGETLGTTPERLNYTLRQPFGVVGKINPYNHPFRFAVEKLAAPLAAGNAVIIKPPEQCPLSTLELGQELASVVPSGLVNIVSGDGEVGRTLVSHPGVPRIAFIGSVETGRAVLRAAAANIKTVSLELGGKNPLIIFPDADPHKAIDAAINGMNFNRAGQSCSSTSRLFVHESLHERIAESLVTRVKKIKIGLPESDDTELGCLVSEEQLNKVTEYISSAIEEGAELLIGGKPPENPELRKGFFVEPTIFDQVKPNMRIAQEEIFGPVISILSWSDYEEMLENVNGVIYGLTAGILTNDLNKALITAERVEVGFVWINSSGHFLGAPYGGVKQSGLMREESLDELHSYTQVKNVNISLT